MSQLQLAGVIRESIVDGPGIRFVVFTQGCPHRCPGCHNPATHDPAGGYAGDTETLLREFRKNPLLAGVTLSGYTIEQLLAGLEGHPGWEELLRQTDILIDGPFLEAQKSLNLRFRGSRNQRAIDPAASLREGRAVEAVL